MRRQAGTTFVELLAVMAVLGLALTATALYLKPVEAPLEAGTELAEGFLRQARARAMATTSAYRVAPAGAGGLAVQSADRCSASTWTLDPAMSLELPREVTWIDTSWSVCFSSRGISDANVIVTLAHPQFGQRQLEILRGGTTRVLS